MPSIFKVKDESAFPAPEAVYNWRVYVLAASAAMGSAMFGYDSAFIGGTLTLPSFKSRFGLAHATSNTAASLSANIVSTFQAGCFFGAIFVYYSSEKFGRRLPLIVCGAIFNLGAVIQLASSGQLGLIYAGRALTGLAVGASSLVIPQYISEWAPPAIRGRLIGMFEMALQCAQIVGFWVNYGVNLHISPTSDTQWRIPFGLQLVFGTLLVVLMSLQPESPRWLIKAGKITRAGDNLSRIRNLPRGDRYVAWEIATIQEQLTREAELGSNRSLTAKIKEAFAPNVRNRLFLATGVFGIVKCTATVIFMLFGIDRIGRRNSLLIGSVGAMIAMYYLSGYSKISGSFHHTVQQDGGAYIAIIMIYLFAIFYAMSWNGIPWIFCAEVFPTAIRSVCLVFTTCTQWLGQFIIVYSNPYMMKNITYGTFIFFGASLTIALFVVFFLMPETKGLSLEDMDILFSTKGLAMNKRRKTDDIVAAQRNAEELTAVEGRSDNAEHLAMKQLSHHVEKA